MQRDSLGKEIMKRDLWSTDTPQSVLHYLNRVRQKTLDEYRSAYEHQLMILNKAGPVSPRVSILEIGCGTGWFTVLARHDGYTAMGIDIDAATVQFAAHGRAIPAGVEPMFSRAGAVALPFPDDQFAFVIANSALEHIRNWRPALEEIHRVLALGGVALIGTTNRYNPVSGEIHFPLYPWLPFALHKRIAVAKRGPDILISGIAWNNFTHPSLRRGLLDAGFSEVYDLVDLIEPDEVRTESRRGLARRVLPLARRYPLVRWLLYWGFSSTELLARKSEC